MAAEIGRSDNIAVAVRLRPFNQRERDREAVCCCEIDGNRLQLTHPTDKSVSRGFTFDFVFDSFTDDPERQATQRTVWEAIGLPILDAAWEGYNVSVFAYGQTGSGKSHSMVGFDGTDKGIIPNACEQMFQRIAANDDDTLNFKVECSMIEIYNERIQDLFVPFNQQRDRKQGLKLRDSPSTGPFVEGLKSVPVASYEQIDSLMTRGTKNRTIAATSMNETSSRAHTIFVVRLTQTRVNHETSSAVDRVSCINLVDLAGSERAVSTGATGDRLKESGHINKSLSALGNVISALAANSQGKRKPQHVPYRDSVLTHLLRNSLGGNARTTMLAAISPADINFDETLSTLKYADRAKQIKNKPIVNEDVNVRLIRQLKEEVAELRAALAQQAAKQSVQAEQQVDQAVAWPSSEIEATLAAEREQMRKRIKEEMQDRLREYESIMAEDTTGGRRGSAHVGQQLGDAGSGHARTDPHLVNINEDPALSGVLVYNLREGANRVGTREAAPGADLTVVLGGLGLSREHATIVREGDELRLWSSSAHARTVLNGTPVRAPPTAAQDAAAGRSPLEAHTAVVLRHNDRVIFGNNNVFRVAVPQAADAATVPVHEIDWQFAMKEVNSEILAAMSNDPANKEREEQFAKEKEEMARRMAALEEELETERQHAAQMRQSTQSSEANEQAWKQREADLQALLAEQMAATETLARRHERDLAERTVLDDQLLRMLPLVHEANSISAELDKAMRFAVKLVTKAADVSPALPLPPGEQQMDGHRMETDIAILVHHDKDEQRGPVMWSQDKFNNRVYIMREMYQQWLANGRSLANTDFDSTEADPFYDPAEDQLLGAARIQLEAVRYLLDVQEATPLVDYRGQSQGELVVSLVPVGRAVDLEALDDLSQMEGGTLDLHVQLVQARGLPNRVVAQCKSLYVAFRFFLGNTVVKSARVPLVSINPKIDHCVVLSEVVTPDFVDFVTTSALVFEVWSSCDDPGEWAAERPETTTDEPSTGAEDESLSADVDSLRSEVLHLRGENAQLRTQLEQAQAELEEWRSAGDVLGKSPRYRSRLESAVQLDRGVNGDVPGRRET